MTQSRSAAIRAVALLTQQLADLFGITASDLQINHDQYSLNGVFTCEHGPRFFKFHQEENEQAMGGA